MIELATEDIAATVTRQDGRVYLIAHTGRVGVSAFCAAVEWYWFTPDTPRNRFYDVYGAEWQNIGWVIIAIPQGRLDAARRLAKQLGLRIADGPPAMMGDERSMIKMQVTSRPAKLAELLKEEEDIPVEFFPGTTLPDGRENRSIFAIENDRGSPVYKNTRRDDEAMLQASEEINELLNKGVKLTPFQIADYIYGSGKFPNA